MKMLILACCALSVILVTPDRAGAQLDWEGIGIRSIEQLSESTARQPSEFAGLPDELQYRSFDPSCEFDYEIEDDWVSIDPGLVAVYMIRPATSRDVVESSLPSHVQVLEGESQFFGSRVERVFSSTGRWRVYECDGVSVPIPVGDRVTLSQLVAEALVSENIQPVRIATSPADVTLVNLPTYFSTEDGSFTKRFSSAYRGRVQVDVSMTPVRTVWNPGDPTSRRIVCGGQGHGIGNARFSGRIFRCAHSYSKPSIHAAPYRIGVTAVYQLEVVTAAPAPLGRLPQLGVAGGDEIRVGELRASLIDPAS